jgi:hypothetical protein
VISYLESSSSAILRDIKMPKLGIQAKEESEAAAAQLFTSLIKHRSLIYATISFMIASLSCLSK